MAQNNYCDTEELEKQWFNWILASSLECDVEHFRAHAIWYTKTLGKSTSDDGEPILRHNVALDNPSYPYKIHCLALPRPIVLYSEHGRIQEYVRGAKTETVFAEIKNNLRLDSDFSLIDPGEYPLFQTERLIPFLLQNGFVCEMPKTQSWQFMLSKIKDICHGVSRKFSLRDDEEYEDLASDAYLQVLNKLSNNKLKYTPGKAPVFNLLTTTIFRCMFSILNKKNNQKAKTAKLLSMAQEGNHENIRSLRTHTGTRKIRP